VRFIAKFLFSTYTKKLKVIARQSRPETFGPSCAMVQAYRTIQRTNWHAGQLYNSTTL